MALPFYNQGDQDIYAGGEHFIPQERFRLGYTAPPSIANATTPSGITNTQAASPYKWPPQGEGGGGGGGFSNTNKFGLDLDTMKTIDSGQWVDGNYEKKSRNIAKDAAGNWKDVETNQNPYHANIGFKGMIGTVMDKVMGKKSIPGVPDEGSWTGAEWDEEFDPTISGKKLNTYQRWKAKKEFKAAQEKAAADKVIADQAIAGAGAAGQRRPGKGGSHMSRSRDQGGLGITAAQAQTVSDANAKAEMSGWNLAQGGRIGLSNGMTPFMAWVKDQYGVNVKDIKDWNFYSGLANEWKRLGGKDGGRIGYAYGEDVNIEGPGFDENIEMASGVDPQDALNDMSLEIFGKGLHELTPEEYQILIDMANEQAAGPEQDQGIASLV